MHVNLDVEMGDENVEESHFVDVRMKTICRVSEYEDGPKEVDKHCIHYWVTIQAFLDIYIASTQKSKKFHDQLFELKIVEDGGVFGLIKYKSKIDVIDDFLNFIDVLFKVTVLNFEAELEVLIVENSNISLQVILKDLHYSRWLKQIIIEELRQVCSVHEQTTAILYLKIL